MVKHIFIAPVKKGVSDREIEKRMNQMRDLIKNVPGLKSIIVEKATGWIGVQDAVVLIAELDNKEDWNNFINNDYHVELGKTDSLYFETDKFICTQIEY